MIATAGRHGARGGWGGILDRYLFVGVGLRLLAVTAIILVILTLENTGRLAADVQRSEVPFQLLGRLSLALIPEHLSTALPIALLLAVASTVRQLALRGEWQILSAAGMSRSRRLAAPFAVAVLAGGLILADRLERRPAGERALDALYSDLRAGAFGLPLPLGEAVPLGNLTTLFVSGARDGAGLTGVVVQRADHVFIASAARVSRSRNGDVVLTLAHGTSLVRLDGGTVRRLSFESLRITGRLPVIDTSGSDFRHRLDRAAPSELLRLAGGPNGPIASAAAMALVMRIDAALFCLLIPWIGSVLATPAPRQLSAVGIGLAILLIVGHLKSAAFVEDRFPEHAILAGFVHFLGWAGLVCVLSGLDARHGEGFAEQVPVWLLGRWPTSRAQQTERIAARLWRTGRVEESVGTW